MSLLPQNLLSDAAKSKCISNIKELPRFVKPNLSTKVLAAVLLPLFVRDDEVHLLYTLRSTNLKSHGGQVSFPGGKLEENEGVVEAALRETEEEIGISRDCIDVWCEMPSVPGRDKSMLITPVVGFVTDINLDNLKVNSFEVDEIFSVPMSSFCNPSKHAHLKYDSMLVPVYGYENYKIWGLTAIITHFFLQCFLPSDSYETNFTRKRYLFDELLPSKL